MLYTIVTLSLYTIPASESLRFEQPLQDFLTDTYRSILHAPSICNHRAKMALRPRNVPDRYCRIRFQPRMSCLLVFKQNVSQHRVHSPMPSRHHSDTSWSSDPSLSAHTTPTTLCKSTACEYRAFHSVEELGSPPPTVVRSVSRITLTLRVRPDFWVASYNRDPRVRHRVRPARDHHNLVADVRDEAGGRPAAHQSLPGVAPPPRRHHLLRVCTYPVRAC